jgi:hypothetical protein
MKTRFRFASLTLASCLFVGSALTTSTASAANLQPAGINLGGTSFFDGFGRYKGGFTYLTYFQYAMIRAINGTTIAGGDGGEPLRVFNEPKIDVLVWLNQLAYTVPESLGDDVAFVGINFVLPIVAFNTEFTPPTMQNPANATLSDNGIGFGDLTFGPFIQFTPLKVGGRPFFSHRFEFDVIAPTGNYNATVDINQSSNFVSFVPNWAATIVPIERWEISARVHFLYNTKTHRPAFGRFYRLQNPPPIDSAQPGHSAWANFATSYEIFDTFHLGANGYYFQQLNLDSWNLLDGSSEPGLRFHDTGKRKILGVGPGVLWHATEHDHLFLNGYTQLISEHGPDADLMVNLRWVHGF